MARDIERIYAAHQAHTNRGGKSLHDTRLEREIFSKLAVLERTIDAIGPTPLRHKLSELIVEMRYEIWSFDQVTFERL